jgi:hypothetical protein
LKTPKLQYTPPSLPNSVWKRKYFGLSLPDLQFNSHFNATVTPPSFRLNSHWRDELGNLTCVSAGFFDTTLFFQSGVEGLLYVLKGLFLSDLHFLCLLKENEAKEKPAQ